jgi:hypothetical protein
LSAVGVPQRVSSDSEPKPLVLDGAHAGIAGRLDVLEAELEQQAAAEAGEP